MKKSIAFLLVLVLSLGLFGCNQTPAPTPDPQPQEPTADAEQFINTYLSADPTSFDISLRSDSYSNAVILNTMESLVRMEERDGEYFLAPGDATTWESNEDGTVWTFHLGDNKWSDGQDVTAHDYVYSLRRSTDPNTGSPNGYFLAPLLNYDACNKGEKPLEDLGAEAKDDKTLVLTLTQPSPAFLMMIDSTIYYPQRQDKIEEWGELYGSEAQYVVNNGPFKMDSWVHNSSLVIVKNEHYWDADSVKLSKVNYAIMPDENTVYNAYESGEIDFVTTGEVEWLDRFTLRDDSDYNQYTSGTITYMFFNNLDDVFSNTKIRKAFTTAIDLDDMNEMCFDGLRVPAGGWVVPTISVGNTNYRETAGDFIQMLKDDLTEAKKTPKDLLLEGMAELGLGSDPATLKVSFSLAGTSDWYRTLGEYLQQTYKNVLGVTLELNFNEWGIFYDNVQKGNYQIGFMSWGAYYNDPYDVLSLFMSEFDMIETGWANQEYDELIARGSVTLDETERIQAYVDAERILIYDECVVSPVATASVNQFVRDYVEEYATLGFSNMGFKYVYTAGR